MPLVFADDAPPCDDLLSIENRTWVYQRPSSVLEIQHVHSHEATYPINKRMAGYEGIRIASASIILEPNELSISGSRVKKVDIAKSLYDVIRYLRRIPGGALALC